MRIFIYCNDCGKGLDFSQRLDRDNDLQFNVMPCLHCMDEKCEEIEENVTANMEAIQKDITSDLNDEIEELQKEIKELVDQVDELENELAGK